MKEIPKILIVDDRVENLIALEKLLSDLDVEFVRAASGNEALKKILVNDFAIALMDVQMPGMDGFETIEFIRNEEKTKHMPVIFITAIFKDEYYHIKGIKTGAVDFITKPIIPEILIGKIRVFLDLHENKKSMEKEIRHRKASDIKLKKLNQELEEKFSELRSSEERFRTLVMTIPDIVYRVDSDGRFTFINESVARLGYLSEELIGEHFSKLIFPVDLETVSRSKVLPQYAGKKIGPKDSPKIFDERRTGDRKTMGLEVRLVPKSGEKVSSGLLAAIDENHIICEINSSGLYAINPNASQKTHIGTVGVIRIITERKRLEIQLQEAYHNLEAKVGVRTMELSETNEALKTEIADHSRAEEALLKAQTQLIQTEKIGALGTMVAGIAHELNNPMMGMLNFIQYCIRHTEKTDKRYPILEDAERETKRCAGIVRNLLTFSRVEDEKEEKYVKQDCAQLFERVLNLLSFRIEKENILVIKNIDDNGTDIWVKISNIQQVFLNLMGNALDAIKESKKKEIRIDIQPEGESVRISITDTGCGIVPDTLQKIFDPFFTTKPVGKGTGLGLSVTRGIVHDHGGTITCQSEIGKGTTIIILLPINKPKH